MWIKHRPSWTQRFAWLLENPDVGADWGLGCRLCSQHSSSSSPWVTFSKGVSGSGVLQVKDFADHEQSEMHKLSLSRSRPPTSEPAALAPDDIDVPTAALIRLSVEVAATPLGAQGLEFERKARLAARSDPANFPPAFGNRMYHGRIVTALATVLLPAWITNFSVSFFFHLGGMTLHVIIVGLRFDEDRELLKKKRVAQVGWAEDRCCCNDTSH